MSTHLCCKWLPSDRQDSSSPLPCSAAPITKSRKTTSPTAQATATRFSATSTSSWSRKRHRRPRPSNNFLFTELPIHAVFISGLPKLPCRNPSGYLSARSTRTMSLDIKHLARRVSSPVWHTTCIRKGRHQQGFRSLEVEMFRRALRQRMPAKRPPRCFSVSSFRGRKNHATRPFWRAGAQPPNAPQLGGSFL
jgi:hypothetical protein